MDNQTLLNSLKDPFLYLDEQGIVRHVNSSWQQLAEALGEPFFCTLVEDHYLLYLIDQGYLQLKEGIEQVLDGETDIYRFTYSCVFKEVKHCSHIEVRPVISEGKIIGALLTQLEMPPLEPQASEISDILESMTDAFYAIDPQWCFQYINKEAGRLLQREPVDLLNKSIWMEFPETKNSELETHYLETMQKGKTSRFEYFYPPLATWFEVNAYPRSKGGISVYFRNINERKKSQKKLWDTAHYDHLTKLPNRRYLVREMEQLTQLQTPFAVFFFDINNFKLVNDVYGHDIGDALIFAIGQRLDKWVNDAFIARQGGDEFVVLYAYDSEEELQRYSEELLEILENEPYQIEPHPPIKITVSIGISMYPKDGGNANDLLVTADLAMYEAKKYKYHGKSCARFRAEMKRTLKRRLLIEKELLTAIDKGELYFLFQPQVRTSDEEIVGVEVLSRWEHPELGLLSPYEFIEIAEETGQITELTMQMIPIVLDSYQEWKNLHQYRGTLAINISSSMLLNDDFVYFMEEIMDQKRLDRGFLELELTENVQLSTSIPIRDRLIRLQASGIRIAIDDFGTGYSRMIYLNHLPVDKIKIDKAFIDQIGQSFKGEAILQSIITMAHNLHIDILAEGVETEMQKNFLRAKGCYVVQGYYYAKPLKESDFIERLELYKEEKI